MLKGAENNMVDDKIDPEGYLVPQYETIVDNQRLSNLKEPQKTIGKQKKPNANLRTLKKS